MKTVTSPGNTASSTWRKSSALYTVTSSLTENNTPPGTEDMITEQSSETGVTTTSASQGIPVPIIIVSGAGSAAVVILLLSLVLGVLCHRHIKRQKNQLKEGAKSGEDFATDDQVTCESINTQQPNTYEAIQVVNRQFSEYAELNIKESETTNQNDAPNAIYCELDNSKRKSNNVTTFATPEPAYFVLESDSKIKNRQVDSQIEPTYFEVETGESEVNPTILLLLSESDRQRELSARAEPTYFELDRSECTPSGDTEVGDGGKCFVLRSDVPPAVYEEVDKFMRQHSRSSADSGCQRNDDK